MSLATTRHRLLAAGLATLCAGGALLAGTAGVAAGAATPRSSFSKTLTDVVAPGTLASTTWTVPGGDALELAKATLQSTVSGTLGQARVELLQEGSSPVVLVGAGLGEIRKAFTASLATPIVSRSGEVIALTVGCDSDQAACKVTLDLSGELVASGLHSSAFASVLEDVVAPGTKASASWTVPAKKTMHFTDLLASSLESGQNGGLRVVLTPAGGKPRTLLRITMAKLGESPFDYRLAGPVAAAAGSTITITVDCGAEQAACNVGVLFSGKLS
jgi:hypothetical protein